MIALLAPSSTGCQDHFQERTARFVRICMSQICRAVDYPFGHEGATVPPYIHIQVAIQHCPVGQQICGELAFTPVVRLRLHHAQPAQNFSHGCCICRQRVSSDSSHPGIARQEDGSKERQERRRKRKEYYQKGVSSGEPATCMLYKLANALNFEDNHLLW